MSVPAIEITSLCKSYHNKFTALNNVSLTVEAGDFYSLLGANGAGKTTLIGVLTTLVTPSSGKTAIFGHDIEQNPIAAKKLIGVVPQEINLPIFETPWQILLYQGAIHGLSSKQSKLNAEKSLKKLQIWDKRKSQVRMLSGGMKRRLMIARALMHQPKLLILDEPTAGVDIEIRRSMWEFLTDMNKNGLTILLTTHYLEEAEKMCNKVTLIQAGEVNYQGDMKPFLAQLETEVVELELNEALFDLPETNNWNLHLKNPKTIEARIHKKENISELITFLSNKNIQIRRMTNKHNRLEELFISLTKKPEES